MKHFKTFESFLNENADITLSEQVLNEGTAWFPGETIDDRINDDSSDWNKFWKGAKVGDTFQSSPDGVELNYCKTSDINQGKKKIAISTTTAGHNYGAKQDKEGALCTIVDRKKVQWIGSDYDESDKIDTIFYTVRGEPGYNVYMLGEM